MAIGPLTLPRVQAPARAPLTAAPGEPAETGVRARVDRLAATVNAERGVAVRPLDPRAAAARTAADHDWLVRHGVYVVAGATGVTLGRPLDMPVDVARERMQLTTNRSAERAALAHLPPADRERYTTLTRQLAPDPRALLALQVLLLEGKLTSGRQDLRPGGPGQSLLANLATLGRLRPAPPLDGQDLLAKTLYELATPEAISQGEIGTCAATSVQIWLALTNPAEYVRLLSGLAANAGRVALAGGGQLTRVEGTLEDDQTGRTSSSRLLEAAFMAFGRGARGYTNDVNVGESASGGMAASENQRLLEGLVGKARVLRTDCAADVNATPGDVYATIEQAAQDGLPVVASLFWGKDFQNKHTHAVLVTGLKDGQVSYMNPWGQQEHMDWIEFQSRIYAATVAAP